MLQNTKLCCKKQFWSNRIFYNIFWKIKFNIYLCWGEAKCNVNSYGFATVAELGGCSDYPSHKFKDRVYTETECYNLCKFNPKDCSGFATRQDDKGWCYLYKNECVNTNTITSWRYQSIAACIGIYELQFIKKNKKTNWVTNNCFLVFILKILILTKSELLSQKWRVFNFFSLFNQKRRILWKLTVKKYLFLSCLSKSVIFLYSFFANILLIVLWVFVQQNRKLKKRKKKISNYEEQYCFFLQKSQRNWNKTCLYSIMPAKHVSYVFKWGSNSFFKKF